MRKAVMNKEMLAMVESLSNERGVDKNVIIEAIEAALATVASKKSGVDAFMRVAVDPNTGDYETFHCWRVVDDFAEPSEFPSQEISLSKAREMDPQLEVGDIIEERSEFQAFDGRI